MSSLPRSSAGRLVPPLLIGILLSLFALWDLRQTPRAFPVLDQDLAPLHQRFDRDRGHVRLLLILDPT